jgi:hypothetical protein
MQIHEITLRRQVDEGLGSFVSGLTGQNRIDKQAAKAAGKLTAKGYGANYQSASDNWEDKYAALQKDTAVASYAKNLAAGWAKNVPTLVKPTQGLTSATTLQKTIPTLVSTAKKSNNTLTSTQIGQILAKSAPTVWSNTADKPAAIAQLKNALAKQGVTVDGGKTAPTSQDTTYDPAKAAADKLAKGQADQDATVAALKARQLGQFAPEPTLATTQTKVSPTTPAPTTSTVRTKYPKAPTPGAISEPIFLGGKKLDPKKPNDAKVIQALQTQGKLHEAATVGPVADQYRTAFVNWSDGQLATRVPETGATITMAQVRDKIPTLSTKLSASLDQVIQTQGTPQQAQAVEEYIKLAVAGVQALAQSSKNGVSASTQQQNTQFATTSGAVKQSLRDAGIDPSKLAQFGAKAANDGNPLAARRTGDTTADTLLKLAGFDLR